MNSAFAWQLVYSVIGLCSVSVAIRLYGSWAHAGGRSKLGLALVLTCLTIDAAVFGATREQVRLTLEQENIESRPVWKPMHLQPVFDGAQVRGGSVSERLFRDGLCLPSGSNLLESDLERIAGIVSRCGRF